MSAQLEEQPVVEYLWVGHEYADKGLADAWPLLRVAVNKYGDGKFSRRAILKKLKDRTAILWLVLVNGAPSSALVTWIDQYDLQRRLTIGFCGGDIDDLKGAYQMIEDYARRDGCCAIEVWGRPGWVKVGKEYGYEKIHDVVRKKL